MRSLPELTALEFPVRRYESLLGLLVDALPASRRADRLRAVGVTFGTELAQLAGLRPTRSVRVGFERMCEAVRSLGYQASVEEVERPRRRDRDPDLPACGRSYALGPTRRRSTAACGRGWRRRPSRE